MGQFEFCVSNSDPHSHVHMFQHLQALSICVGKENLAAHLEFLLVDYYSVAHEDLRILKPQNLDKVALIHENLRQTNASSRSTGNPVIWHNFELHALLSVTVLSDARTGPRILCDTHGQPGRNIYRKYVPSLTRRSR